MADGRPRGDADLQLRDALVDAVDVSVDVVAVVTPNRGGKRRIADLLRASRTSFTPARGIGGAVSVAATLRRRLVASHAAAAHATRAPGMIGASRSFARLLASTTVLGAATSISASSADIALIVTMIAPERARIEQAPPGNSVPSRTAADG
jgi:hypothetical protein